MFLAVIEVDGQDYALLTPIEFTESGSEDDLTDVFIFHYEVDAAGNEIFIEIADAATFNRVQQETKIAISDLKEHGEE